MTKRFLLATLAVGFLAGHAPVRADDVTTKNGRVYKELTLVRETKTTYFFEDEKGRKIRIKKESVEKWEKKPTRRGELYSRMKGLGKKEVTKRLEVAEWALANGFPKEAKKLYKDVLKVDKNNAVARAGVGDQLVDGKWVTAAQLEREREKRMKVRYDKLGYKKFKGEYLSPVAYHRQKNKMVEVDGHWVTAKLAKDIASKSMKWFEGEWYTPDEMKRIDGGERRVDGQWASISTLNERFKQDLVTNWVVKGRFVEIHSNANYDRVQEALQIAEEAYDNLLTIFGGEHPDLYGRRGRLAILLGRGPKSYGALGTADGVSNREAAKSSANGAFYGRSLLGGRGAGATYAYGDKSYVDMWVRHATALAFIDRLGSWESFDPALTEGIAGLVTGMKDGKFEPMEELAIRYLTGRDTRHPVDPGSGLLEAAVADGYSSLPSGRRGVSYERRPLQAGLFMSFLREKNPQVFEAGIAEFMIQAMTGERLTRQIMGTDATRPIDEAFAAWHKAWRLARKL